MMKKFLRKHTLWFVILGTTLTSVISYGFIDEYFEVSKNLDIFSSVYREVNMYYVDLLIPENS